MFGHNFNKFKHGLILQSETAEGLLKMIQGIRCQVEVMQMYHDGSKHIALLITEKRLIKKVKQEN